MCTCVQFVVLLVKFGFLPPFAAFVLNQYKIPHVGPEICYSSRSTEPESRLKYLLAPKTRGAWRPGEGHFYYVIYYQHVSDEVKKSSYIK